MMTVRITRSAGVGDEGIKFNSRRGCDVCLAANNIDTDERYYYCYYYYWVMTTGRPKFTATVISAAWVNPVRMVISRDRGNHNITGATSSCFKRKFRHRENDEHLAIIGPSVISRTYYVYDYSIRYLTRRFVPMKFCSKNTFYGN